MEKVYENIKKLRLLHKYSMSEMSEKLKINQSSYFQLEKGETKLTIERLYEIADIFKVSVLELLNGTDESLLEKQDNTALVNEIEILKERIKDLEDDKRRLKKQLDDYEFDLPDMSNALLYSFILGAIEPLIQLFYLKKKAVNEGDNDEVLELSEQIYGAFYNGLKISRGIEIESLYNGDDTKWSIDTSKFNKTLTNDYRLKSIIGEINVPIFKEEYYTFLSKYREGLKK